MFWKDSLPKKNRTGKWFLLYYQEKWCSFFPKIWSYSLAGKWKIIFLRKYMDICYFLQIFWNNIFSKKITLEFDLSCVIRQDDLNFFPKVWSYCLDGKWKIIFLKEMHGNIIFYVYLVKMVSLVSANVILPFCQKSKDDPLPKNTLLLKTTFPVPLKRNDIHRRKYGISSDRKPKRDKKVYLAKYS